MVFWREPVVDSVDKGGITVGRRETALKYFEENKEYMQARINYGIEMYRKGKFHTFILVLNSLMARFQSVV